MGVLVDFLKNNLHLASPQTIVIVFGLGVVWSFVQPASRAPRRYLAGAVFGFWLMATPLGAGVLSWGLAHGLTQVATLDEARGATAVVVLGGGAQTYSAGGQVVGTLPPASVFRSLEGARVSKLIGAGLVIASGGVPRPKEQLKPESEMIRGVLVQAGVPLETILEDSASRTTREQGHVIAPLLRARGVRQFVLVTSPVHMRRSLAVFRLEGFDPVPSVSLMRSEHLPRPSLLWPNSSSLDLSQEAIYDYAAMAYYWSRGWL
ncbi:MAG: YdcF family protein [Acidobacteriota bacterium]